MLINFNIVIDYGNEIIYAYPIWNLLSGSLENGKGENRIEKTNK